MQSLNADLISAKVGTGFGISLDGFVAEFGGCQVMGASFLLSISKMLLPVQKGWMGSFVEFLIRFYQSKIFA